MSATGEILGPEQTQARLEEIRERAARALPGPWFWRGNRKAGTVSLSNPYDGASMILDVDVRYIENIYDHVDCEGCTLEEARERYLLGPELMPTRPYEELEAADLRELCGRRGIEHVEHGEGAEIWSTGDYIDALLDWDDDHGYDRAAEVARQTDLRDFLAPDPYPGSLDGPSSFSKDGHVWLTRSVQAVPDLRLNVDGLMHGYGELARFAVLDGRTEAEHEAEGGMIDGERRDLYREDIVGIDTPEAEFIAHSREDIAFLLERVSRLEAEMAERP